MTIIKVIYRLLFSFQLIRQCQWQSIPLQLFPVIGSVPHVLEFKKNLYHLHVNHTISAFACGNEPEHFALNGELHSDTYETWQEVLQSKFIHSPNASYEHVCTEGRPCSQDPQSNPDVYLRFSSVHPLTRHSHNREIEKQF